MHDQQRAAWQQQIDTLKKMFDGHFILTGMFNLDGEHGMKAELHPVYAMSALRDGFENAPNDEVWLMFVRNQGDEGYCSSNFWDSGFEDYTVKLPWRPGMTSVDVNWNATQFVGTDGTSGPTVRTLPPPAADAGVYVSFTWDRQCTTVSSLSRAPPCRSSTGPCTWCGQDPASCDRQ